MLVTGEVRGGTQWEIFPQKKHCSLEHQKIEASLAPADVSAIHSIESKHCRATGCIVRISDNERQYRTGACDKMLLGAAVVSYLI
jgi:hypothetical protein